ncbi:hypothetical protein HY251_07590 [bacterium]|nr:hypothetical protein [bacterium]
MDLDLGPQTSEHAWQATTGLVVSGFFFLLPLPVIAVLASREDPARWGAVEYTGLVIMGFVCLGLPIVFWTTAYRRSGSRVLVFLKGIVYQERFRTRRITWDEVASLRSRVTQRDGPTDGPYRPIMHEHTLTSRSGEKMMLTHGLSDIWGLLAVLEQKVVETLLPIAIADYRAGDAVAFGPLSVNMLGISKGGALLPWEELDHVHISGDSVVNGSLVVRKRDKTLPWAAVDLGKVDNYRVLLELLRKRREAELGPDAK